MHDTGLKSAYEDVAKHNWTQAEREVYDYVLMREQDERPTSALQKDASVASANRLSSE